MSELDANQLYDTYDTQNAYGSVLALGAQLTQAWNEVDDISLPESLKGHKRIALCGMGGSGLGGRMVRSIFGDQMTAPLISVNNYTLPDWAKTDTLVIAVSYSGSTEEIVSLAEQATESNVPLFLIATGSTLAELAKTHAIPAYIFDDTETNPAGMPRMGIGLTFGAEARLLGKLGYLALDEGELKDAIQEMQAQQAPLLREVVEQNNPAKQLATNIQARLPILIASEHLTGNTYVARNQIHETAKLFAACHDIPELNHHLMEGLSYPAEIKQAIAVFFESSTYLARNQERHNITKDVLSKQDIDVHTITVSGSTKLAESLATLQFTSFLAYYTGMLNHVEPANIPWVDYFKENLS